MMRKATKFAPLQFSISHCKKIERNSHTNLNAVKVINLQRTMSHRDNEESRRVNKVKNEWMWGFPFHWDETVVKYADGSTYSGHLTRDGQRTGTGTLHTPIMVYGEVDPSDSSSIIRYMEYAGFWADNKPNGFGTIKKYSGEKSVVMYTGKWVNGEPVNDP